MPSLSSLAAVAILVVGTLAFLYLALVTGQLLLGFGVRAAAVVLAAGTKRRW